MQVRFRVKFTAEVEVTVLGSGVTVDEAFMDGMVKLRQALKKGKIAKDVEFFIEDTKVETVH